MIAEVEMNLIIAERQVTAALTKRVTSAADLNYKPSDKVLTFDEQSQQ